MALSEKNYQRVRSWCKERTGVELGEKRQTMVNARLIKRCCALAINTLDDYIESLAKSYPDNPEWDHFIHLVTTHETYFNREAKHFAFIREKIFPNLDHQNLKMLSAACSTGEEAYSLALEASEFLGTENTWEVHGFDISPQVIKFARSAIYPETRLQDLPKSYLKPYFLKGLDENSGYALVKDKLKKRVQFYVGNLLHPIPNAPFDIILCRNTLMYFDWETKQRVINNLINALKPNGYLFVSQTEQLTGLIEESWRIGPSLIKKSHT